MRMLAKVFAVVTLSVGAGFVAGAIAFTQTGMEGNLINGVFHHISEVIGIGVGMITASLTTMGMLWLGRREAVLAGIAKPSPFPRRDEV
jgi:hypothetical protein